MKIHLAYSTKLALDEIGNYETESRGIVDIAVSTMLYNYWAGQNGQKMQGLPIKYIHKIYTSQG